MPLSEERQKIFDSIQSHSLHIAREKNLDYVPRELSLLSLLVSRKKLRATIQEIHNIDIEGFCDHLEIKYEQLQFFVEGIQDGYDPEMLHIKANSSEKNTLPDLEFLSTVGRYLQMEIYQKDRGLSIRKPIRDELEQPCPTVTYSITRPNGNQPNAVENIEISSTTFLLYLATKEVICDSLSHDQRYWSEAMDKFFINQETGVPFIAYPYDLEVAEVMHMNAFPHLYQQPQKKGLITQLGEWVDRRFAPKTPPPPPSPS